MDPRTKDRLQTALLYLLFVAVYVVVAGLLGSFVGIIVGRTEDDVLRAAVIGGVLGLALGVVVAIIGRHLPPPERDGPSGRAGPTVGDSSGRPDRPSAPADDAEPRAE